jgi:hypothetical protein
MLKLTAVVDGCFAFAVMAAAVVKVADAAYDGLTIDRGCPRTCRCVALNIKNEQISQQN